MITGIPTYPVQFSVDYPDRELDRLTTFFRPLVAPKGVMLSHRDALRQVENWRRLSGAFDAGGRLMCYSALAHVGEH